MLAIHMLREDYRHDQWIRGKQQMTTSSNIRMRARHHNTTSNPLPQGRGEGLDAFHSPEVKMFEMNRGRGVCFEDSTSSFDTAHT